MIDWLFRNRQTGEITIAQVPNAPLIVFMVAVAVRFVFHPSGWPGTVSARSPPWRSSCGPATRSSVA